MESSHILLPELKYFLDYTYNIQHVDDLSNTIETINANTIGNLDVSGTTQKPRGLEKGGHY